MVMPDIIQELKKKEYQDGITLLTITGDRGLCCRVAANYIYRQTYRGPIEWLVVDDGNQHLNFDNPDEINYINEPDDDSFGELQPDINHIKRNKIHDKVKSFIGNLREALVNIKYNKILIIEDDDWYSPNYIQLYSQRLERYDLVGEGPARYYNVRTRTYRAWGNADRASFCQTAFTSKVIPSVYLCTQPASDNYSPFVDNRLWKKDHKKFVFRDDYHCIGIKGMPGRKGIGSGHRPNKKYKPDPDMQVLAKWIGEEDANFYRSLKFDA